MFETRNVGQRIVLQIVLTILVLPFLFPLIVMVQGSLAGQGWGNYRTVLEVPGLWRFFVNTLIITFGVVLIVYIVAMLAAYGFAKLRIPGRELFFWLLLGCLTLPEVVLLAPLFVTRPQAWSVQQLLGGGTTARSPAGAVRRPVDPQLLGRRAARVVRGHTSGRGQMPSACSASWSFP